MKKLLSILVLSVIFLSACEEEPVQTMNDINDQWMEKAKDVEQAQVVIDELLTKYKAVAYNLNTPEGGSGPLSATLYNEDKKEIAISGKDHEVLVMAIMTKKSSSIEMQQLSDVDEVFTIVEEQPQPKDGMAAFYKYISENMKYPEQAKRMGVEGKVYVQFVVTEFGELVDVQAVKGIGAGCDAEAIRVIKESPLWEPGRQRGKEVKVRMVLPITFKLS